MFRSPFYLSVIQNQEGLWQSAMLTEHELDRGEGNLWAAGSFEYSNREGAEREARLWARHENYRFIAPEEVAV